MKTQEQKLAKLQRDVEKHEAYVSKWLLEIFPDCTECIDVINGIGTGMRLAIPRSRVGPARLIRVPSYAEVAGAEVAGAEVDVSARALVELMESGLLSEQTEHRHNGKLGWREQG